MKYCIFQRNNEKKLTIINITQYSNSRLITLVIVLNQLVTLTIWIMTMYVVTKGKICTKKKEITDIK